MVSFVAAIALLLPARLLAHSVADVPYLQEVAFRSTFSSAPSVADWEVLPFDLSTEKYSVAHLWSSDCFIALAGDQLYFSARKLGNRTTEDKINLVNPYTAWRELANMQGDTPMAVINSANDRFSFFVATSTNIEGFTLGPPSASNACGAVLARQTVLEENVSFADIKAISSSSHFIWTSSSLGLSQISIEDGLIAAIDVGTDVITSIAWVDSWAKLFVGCATTLRTFSYSSDLVIQKVSSEWIGAFIDTVPLDMSYDAVNDALWLAEANSVHKRTAAGVWWRIGQRQGAPFDQITSVSAVNGFIWVGSEKGLARVRGDISPVQKYELSTDGASSSEDVHGSDPWKWLYYGGNRYLPSTIVNAVVGGVLETGSRDLVESSVLAVTGSGLSLLTASQWSLSEKAEAMGKFQRRHDRHGLTTGVNLQVYGDVASYSQRCDDNDGLWTSMHAMGEVYRYLSTGEEEARDLAWRAFEALEMLSVLPGDYPRFPARSFTPVSESSWSGCDGDVWVDSPVNKDYRWKSTTSSDEIDGHLAVYPLIYDHIARTPEEQARAYALIEGITGGILDNDLYLIDPSTGKPTQWGFWNPELVNEDPEHYSERGTNSVGILAYTASAFSITQDEKYKKTFWDLAINHDYLANALNGKIDSPAEDNHSDNELFFQAYHILLYALQRLENQKDSTLYSDVKAMVDAVLPSMQRTYALINGELSPLWLGIYAGTGKQTVKPDAVSNAVWTLRHWAIDLIEWPVSNDERWDITESPFYARDSTTEKLMRQIRPPSERRTSKWNSDPFVLTDEGDGMGEEYPSVWRYPYYLMLYNKLIV